MHYFLVAVALYCTVVVPAQAAPQTNFKATPARIVASGPCAVTTVRRVAPRLEGGTQTHFTRQDFISSGVAVTFNTKIGNPSGVAWAAVVHYQNEPGNQVMMNERVGDRVRVCFLSTPQADAECNPKLDGRGREFSVYDYRQHASYSGMNSEHGCGGA